VRNPKAQAKSPGDKVKNSKLRIVLHFWP
jgi:hypothetical protein